MQVKETTMTNINDYITNPQSTDKSPEYLHRELSLQKWDQGIADEIAAQENLVLTDDHWLVIDFLQHYYLKHGWPKGSYELTQKLDEQFSYKGGKRYLYKLFPKGPIVQSSRIAGLPEFHKAKNNSFGSVQ